MKITKSKRNISKAGILIHILFIVLALMCVLPIVLAVSVSFTDNLALTRYGYNFIPKKFSLDAYSYVLDNASAMIKAYGVTIFVTVVGTVLSTLVIAMYAFVISRKDFKRRSLFTFIMFFTMLFNGGTVSWYLVCTGIGLRDNLLALILPYCFNAWYCVIMKTFFSTNVPASLIESAKIDGAGEYMIFFKIVLPISLPGLATIALFSCLGYWNDWWLPLMLVPDTSLSNIQYLLYRIMSNVQAISTNSNLTTSLSMVELPTESVRMALCVIAMGPIVLAYPFFQRYFIEGLTIGAIKG